MSRKITVPAELVMKEYAQMKRNAVKVEKLKPYSFGQLASYLFEKYKIKVSKSRIIQIVHEQLRKRG